MGPSREPCMVACARGCAASVNPVVVACLAAGEARRSQYHVFVARSWHLPNPVEGEEVDACSAEAATSFHIWRLQLSTSPWCRR